MVVKMSSPGRSFGGVADYCLHDPRLPGEAHHPESAERVEWTETRNLATSEGERAGRIMAATAEASPELKRLAGVAATGRKLEKPVCHYSLSWAKDEKPDRQEMRRAAQESLKALGMERRQALIVSHRDGQPHVHVIANRVDPESGKAAGLSRSKLKLSKWAEGYEREQGKIRCPQRERNNARRGQGKRVQDRVSRPIGRHRREEMSPQREQREAIPAGRDGWGGPERERVAWQRAEERAHWEQLQRRRGKALGELEKRSKREWSALYGRHQRQREQLAKDCRGELPRTAGHPFYERLNGLFNEHGFDDFVEGLCAKFYADKMGRPSLAPGVYFRLLLVGYFEGIGSERGIAWRASDSLGLREFLGLKLSESPSDHSTISRTRRLIDVATHEAVFDWGQDDRHRCQLPGRLVSHEGTPGLVIALHWQRLTQLDNDIVLNTLQASARRVSSSAGQVCQRMPCCVVWRR